MIAALVALWVASFAPFPSYNAPSRANAPTLQPGDHFRVNRLAYVYGGPDRGDFVVFDVPAGVPRRVSRIVGLGGDTLEARDGHLIRNGQPVTERYLAAGISTNDFGPVIVPKGSVFVMGDNRPDSQDSRSYGPIAESALVGRVMLITRPVGRFGRP